MLVRDEHINHDHVLGHGQPLVDLDSWFPNFTDFFFPTQIFFAAHNMQMKKNWGRIFLSMIASKIFKENFEFLVENTFDDFNF